VHVSFEKDLTTEHAETTEKRQVIILERVMGSEEFFQNFHFSFLEHARFIRCGILDRDFTDLHRLNKN